MNTLHYYGTDLRQAGHYFWDLNGDRMDRSKLYFKDIPFDPYNGQKGRKGEVVYWGIDTTIDQWSVCVIGGSCIDGRNGCVSTFFVKEKLTLEELKQRILETPIAKRIIDQMPFEVAWP